METKFIFHKFYHGHLLRKKWPEKPQVTQQMLKEYCNCSDDRIVIGKKRPTIMVVDAFEKPEKTHTPINNQTQNNNYESIRNSQSYY